MAKHELLAAKPKPTKPRAEIRAAPSFYEVTHPVGSAERFLDEAAKEALAAAAAGGVITPRQAAIGAVRAVAKEAGKYPDPLLAEAAKLPKDELLKRAARAEAFQKAMDVQNKVAAAAAAIDSPVGRMVTTLAAANTAIDSTAGNGDVRQAAKGGDSAGKDDLASPPPGVRLTVPEAGGPRIVINPKVFEDKRDALCVAFNEAFRVVMEDNGFEPVSEPTDRQRRFFADTAYADDEVQLRRTILARIATLDTSVSDPTDEQLQETAEMLGMVMEVGAPQNEWERRCVKRLLDVVSASLNGTKNPGNPLDNEPPDMV